MAVEPEKNEHMIVGVGASAGGLTPIKKFVRSLPKNPGMSYIIIQHLDPNHESMLPDILGRESNIPVKTAEHGEQVKKNTIYVIPPDAYLELKDNTLVLSDLENDRGSRKAIDQFFRSLAQDSGENCAGIILSGSGSDGTAGLRAIKASGGLVLVQDPDEADHPSMPESAIEADVVDKVLPVEEMFQIVKRYADHPMTQRYEEARDNATQHPPDPEESLNELSAILKTHEGFHLTQYKPATIQRRVARRMSLTNTISYETYLQLLRESEKERQQLTKDLLINVTDFFRDPEAFEIIEEKIIPEILEQTEPDQEIRAWVAGCASGEEAYSIAILLLEALEKRELKNSIKIFATDIDEYAIKIARKAEYPESITAEVPQHYLDKYFIKVENSHHYRVKSQIRDLISFATHNVALHPPFNHMQLISCRNLLIYLKKEVQEKVLASFYCALDDTCHLFLGSSESLGNRAELFKTTSKKWRIYKKIPGANQRQALMEHLHIDKGSQTTINSDRNRPSQRREKIATRSDNIRKAILETQAPPTLVVNEDGALLYFHGDLEFYCVIPEGEPRNEITQVVKPALRSRMRSAFYKVKKTQETLSFRCSIPAQDNANKHIVRVKIVPVPSQAFIDGIAYTISFSVEANSENRQESSISREDEQKAYAELEHELIETREELQNTIEELETSSEELKASHEEALSTNEELQSSNEELEASAEELRSLNEELSTVNAQLKSKIDELRRAHNDVENFFASTDIPTLFLDPELKVKRYTPAAELLLRMGSRDMGRHINSLLPDLIGQNLTDECNEVLQNFQPKYREVQDYKGRWFIRQVTPYRTEERRIEGVVLVFQDVTELKNLSQRAESREKQQAVVAKLGVLALSGVEPQELMRQAVLQVAHVLNADLCKILRYQPDTNDLVMVAGIGWKDGLVGNISVPADHNSQAGYTLAAKEPVIVKNLPEEKRFTGPKLLTDHNVVSGISCIINHTEPPFGVLSIHTKEQREFTQDDANFLQSIANLFSVAIRTKEFQKKVFQSEERLNMARDAAHIGIHDFNLIKNTIIWDDNHREMWGIPREIPITYETFESGLHPDDRGRIGQEIEHAKHKPGKHSWEFRVVNKQSGNTLYISATGHVVHQDGNAVRIVGTVQDVTNRKNLEHSLQVAIDELKVINQRKNEFLAILGHELRNPLASLSNSIEIIEQNKEETNNLIPVMKHSADTMSNLLNDLLDLNRISQNRVKLDLQRVNVKQLLEDVIAQTARLIKEKEQIVTCQIDPQLLVFGDYTRLEQIFTNLIVNANKYTGHAGTLAVLATREKNNIRIEVKDTGVGISKDKLNKIFDAFYQITPGGQVAQGLGIGLALVQNLVRMHGGEIRAESEGKGLGSNFVVILPAIDRFNSAKETPPSQEKREVRAGLKVLLIDDNLDILQTLPILLGSLGCSVDTASTGEQGLERVSHFEPEAILIDIGLPDISGHEVARRVRADGYKGLLVAISGYSHQEAREESIRSGFNDHLAKPAKLVDIEAVLADFSNN